MFTATRQGYGNAYHPSHANKTKWNRRFTQNDGAVLAVQEDPQRREGNEIHNANDMSEFDSFILQSPRPATNKPEASDTVRTANKAWDLFGIFSLLRTKPGFHRTNSNMGPKMAIHFGRTKAGNTVNAGMGSEPLALEPASQSTQ